ncbi:MAG: DNA polymerase III subunit beta [Breznakibacter sp.]
MKFVVSSTDLLNHLQAISRVISNKSSLPILDNFLFNIKGNLLTMTASDLEVTMITSMEISNVDEDGVVAIPSRILLETLKKFPEQPLSFVISKESFAVEIVTDKGKFNLVGQNADEYPVLQELDANKLSSVRLGADLLLTGINKTFFATADDELRPVMNGILFEMSPEHLTFVASDSHKLVRYRRTDIQTEFTSAFILHKKPSGLLKNILAKADGDVQVEFDDKNAVFTTPVYKMVCRLIEGVYPAYNAVIPQGSPYKVMVDRVEFFNTLGRVSLFSNQGTNLVKLKLSDSQMTVSAQDLDFSISAFEVLPCVYDGEEMEIGFKSNFLADILNNMDSREVALELSDPSRAGILVPVEKEESEDELMLLMPMMVNV